MTLYYGSAKKVKVLENKIPFKVLEGYNKNKEYIKIKTYQLNESKGYQTDYKPIVNFYMVVYKDINKILEPIDLYNTRVLNKFNDWINGFKKHNFKEVV